MKRLFVLCALLLTLAAPHAMTAGSAGQIRVPDDYATIQEAVNAAAPGDTITVGPGVYCEQVVISTDEVWLRAAPARRADRTVLTGACGTGGYGIHVRRASAATPVSGVQISGFVVEGFDSGIVLENATRSRVHLNEVRENVHRASTTPAYGRSQGILLVAASSNEVTQNWSHDNGHLGIGMFNGSNGNLVRGNTLTGNRGACALMVWGTTNRWNRLVENEVTGSIGNGIMVGPNPQALNLVAQNRVHGFPFAGIVVNPGSYSNEILQNDARGNGVNGSVDLKDYTTANTWLRNLGTCTPGNAGCE